MAQRMNCLVCDAFLGLDGEAEGTEVETVTYRAMACPEHAAAAQEELDRFQHVNDDYEEAA